MQNKGSYISFNSVNKGEIYQKEVPTGVAPSVRMDQNGAELHQFPCHARSAIFCLNAFHFKRWKLCVCFSRRRQISSFMNDTLGAGKPKRVIKEGGDEHYEKKVGTPLEGNVVTAMWGLQ